MLRDVTALGPHPILGPSAGAVQQEEHRAAPLARSRRGGARCAQPARMVLAVEAHGPRATTLRLGRLDRDQPLRGRRRRRPVRDGERHAAVRTAVPSSRRPPRRPRRWPRRGGRRCAGRPRWPRSGPCRVVRAPRVTPPLSCRVTPATARSRLRSSCSAKRMIPHSTLRRVPSPLRSQGPQRDGVGIALAVPARNQRDQLHLARAEAREACSSGSGSGNGDGGRRSRS